MCFCHKTLKTNKTIFYRKVANRLFPCGDTVVEPKLIIVLHVL